MREEGFRLMYVAVVFKTQADNIKAKRGVQLANQSACRARMQVVPVRKQA